VNVPWNRINPAEFEKLALEYAQFEYPKLKWVPTPRTGDGNRDAEATTHDWVLDRLVEYQNWLEAKFHHKSGKPSRSQLDPTLVSGLIDPRVRAILFVTNGRIPASYMARAERVFSRPPDRFVAFKEGRDLLSWLSRHESIALRYFGAAMGVDTVSQVLPLEISSASLLDISDYRRALYKPVSHLYIGRDYLLHLILRSPEPRKLELQLPEQSPLVVPGPLEERLIQISAGISSRCIRMVPRQIGVFPDCPVVLEGQNVSATRVLTRHLTIRGDSSLRIVFAGQAKAATHIKQLMHSLRKSSNAICCLYGKGGVGKTHILDSLEADLDLQTDFFRIGFSGHQGEDARLICELLLFLHFGPAGLNLETIDRSLVASSRQVRFFGLRLLDGLGRGICDAAEARALVRDLVGNRDVRSVGALLVDPQPAATPVVVVADDLHKLRGPEALLFARILTDHFSGNHNSLLLLSARREEFHDSTLKTAIDDSAIYSEELLPPTADEVVESIDQLLGRPCPRAFSGALSSIAYTTLNIANLLVDLRSRDQKLNEPAFVRALDQWTKTVSIGKDKVVLERIAKSRRLFSMLDIVYAVRIGLPLQPLVAKFGSRAIDTAANRDLLRLNADRAAVPFHDLVYDAYVELRGTCHTHEVGTFLAECLEQGTVTPDRALPPLLRCGPSFENRYLDAALAYRDSFIDVGRFGPALEVSKSVVTVQERRQTNASADKAALAGAWFVYAECLNHCSSSDDALQYFEKARGTLATKWADPSSNGVHFEAEAELFNLSFWDLEVHRLAELERFVSKLKRAMAEEPKVRQERRFIRAYLTALNRLMMFFLLADKPAEELLKENLKVAEDLGMPNYSGFALIDHAKGSYHSNLERALGQLREGNQLFHRLGSEQRRELTSAAETAFIECRLGLGSISAVASAARSLLDEGLWPEYLNAHLKLVALMLARGDCEEASAQIAEFYQRRSTVSDDPRRALLLANIEAGAAFLWGDNDAAQVWTLEHQKLVGNIGSSYQAVARHNLSACVRNSQRSKDIGWFACGVRHPAGRFLLEPRIW
jgi:hypothetical protein